MSFASISVFVLSIAVTSRQVYPGILGHRMLHAAKLILTTTKVEGDEKRVKVELAQFRYGCGR